MDLEHPVVGAASRVLGVVVASLVVVLGFFDGTVTEAVSLGLVVGVGWAVAAAVGHRLLP